MNRIYLDNAATTPVKPQVLQAMLPYYGELHGNPSSIHLVGRQAREAVDDARQEIASLLGARDEEIVFTSGGTEADNLAIKGVAHALKKKGRHIITTRVEHHAVIKACRALEAEGFDVTYLPVDRWGIVDPGLVEESIRDDTILISVMHANNEVGTVEPIEEIGLVAQEEGVCLHSDAVQTFGHIPTIVDHLGVDLLSTSAHKLHGPKGTGALYIREDTEIEPLIHGGNQERGRRASTENVPGIVGCGEAAKIAADRMEKRETEIVRLRNVLLRGIAERIDQTRLNGHPTRRLPGNINMVIRYVEGESMVLALDQRGIAISTGSACSSGDLQPSHVLTALGLRPEEAHSSIRLSVGSTNTEEEMGIALEAVVECAEKLRQMSPLYTNKPYPQPRAVQPVRLWGR